MAKILFILNDPWRRALVQRSDAELAEGCHRGSLEELTNWTLWADKVLVF
jgi:sulfur relay (sulfurtransferase) complex TusBCD TusD component (DsrE family)